MHLKSGHARVSLASVSLLVYFDGAINNFLLRFTLTGLSLSLSLSHSLSLSVSISVSLLLGKRNKQMHISSRKEGLRA